jgi:hypothetical protein
MHTEGAPKKLQEIFDELQCQSCRLWGMTLSTFEYVVSLHCLLENQPPHSPIHPPASHLRIHLLTHLLKY